MKGNHESLQREKLLLRERSWEEKIQWNTRLSTSSNDTALHNQQLDPLLHESWEVHNKKRLCSDQILQTSYLLGNQLSSNVSTAVHCPINSWSHLICFAATCAANIVNHSNCPWKHIWGHGVATNNNWCLTCWILKFITYLLEKFPKKVPGFTKSKRLKSINPKGMSSFLRKFYIGQKVFNRPKRGNSGNGQKNFFCKRSSTTSLTPLLCSPTSGSILVCFWFLINH